LLFLLAARTEADYREKEFSREEVQEYIEFEKKDLQQIDELAYELGSYSSQIQVLMDQV